jgi:hypothetical protein
MLAAAGEKTLRKLVPNFREHLKAELLRKPLPRLYEKWFLEGISLL